MLRTDLCFTTPTVLRHVLLRETYASFEDGLGVSFKAFRLFLNIDNAPNNPDCTVADVVAVAKSFFGDVVFNAPALPSFPLAVKWLWSQVGNYAYTFHLEDDWLMTRRVALDTMLDALRTARCKAGPVWQCRLLKIDSANTPAVCMTPSVFKSELIHGLAQSMHGDGDPEKQLRRHILNTYGNHKLALMFPKRGAVVLDNGRAWRAKRNIKKPRELGGTKDSFVRWIEPGV